MATLQDYLGITALRDAWPKWKANVIAINNQVINHVAGSADKHSAQDITYTGDFDGKTEVKAALDQAKTEIDTIVISASIDPEVAFARDSAVKSKVFGSLDARLEEDEQDFVSYKAETTAQINDLMAAKLFKIFATMPTVDQLAANEVGLVLGDIVYPITMQDLMVLTNGFTFRRYGALASGAETALGKYHLNTLSLPVTTKANQLEGVATLVKDMASPYVVTFAHEDVTKPLFATEHKGCISFIYDVSVNKEILSPTDHAIYRKVMLQKVYFLDGDIGFSIIYWDSSSGIHYWSGTTWLGTTQKISKGANFKLGVSITRNANNSYTIVLTNATTSAAITTATTGTDLRHGTNTTDRVFIGDHITDIGDKYYDNQDISIDSVVV